MTQASKGTSLSFSELLCSPTALSQSSESCGKEREDLLPLFLLCIFESRLRVEWGPGEGKEKYSIHSEWGFVKGH